MIVTAKYYGRVEVQAEGIGRQVFQATGNRGSGRYTQ